MDSVSPIEGYAVVAGERHAVAEWFAFAEERFDYPVQRDNSVS
jgi:hypothetical protein